MAAAAFIRRAQRSEVCLPEPIIIYDNLHTLICASDRCFSSGVPVSKQLYQSIKKVQEFFLEVFGLCGIDGKGKTPPFTLGIKEENAAWVCRGADCSWEFHNDFAVIPEVVAHEFSHAVVQHARRTPLVLEGQSGALNESIANVLAVAFRHWSGQTDWTIGDLYDLSAHADMKGFKVGSHDAGYIHDNSAIPSHAFFMAVGCTKSTSYGKIGKIWFDAMTKVDSSSDFGEFALKTVALASDSPRIRKAIGEAWVHVGVLRLAVPRPPAAANSRVRR